MDNLRSTRQRGRVRATLTRQEFEEFIDKMLRNSGAGVLNKLRDQAREIAPHLGMCSEAKKLSAIIGAMMGTQEGHLSSDLAQRFVGGIDFSNYLKAVKALESCHAFGKPADAMGSGDRLILRGS